MSHELHIMIEAHHRGQRISAYECLCGEQFHDRQALSEHISDQDWRRPVPEHRIAPICRICGQSGHRWQCCGDEE